MRRIPFLIILLAVVCLSCRRETDYDRQIRQELTELDAIIASRPPKDEQKLQRIQTLTGLGLYSQLVDEYGGYQFDSLIFYLERQNRHAEEVGDADLAESVRISLATNFSSAGYYLEAYDILSGIDTSSFTDEKSRRYYMALYTLSRELEDNAASLEGYRMLQRSSDYIAKAFSFCRPGSFSWKLARVQMYMRQGSFSKADMAANEILQDLDIGSVGYGNVSYMKSIIVGELGRDTEKLLWEIRSSKSDMLNLNRDYTSLMLVAEDVADKYPNRAFSYIQRCLEDALYYNGKLRSWQISSRLPGIHKAFVDHQTKARKLRFLLISALSVLVLILIFVLASLARASRAQARTKAALAEANALREKYITEFLSRQADWIDKQKKSQSEIIRKLRYGKTDEVIKDLGLSRFSEVEMQRFHELFDRTFLGMFPTFVEDFNDLLEEDARFHLLPENGSITLPTELRIYALTRLGIDDAGEIARLLGYSVRTIYNYKVKIRNSAACPKEDFDAAVMAIGRHG